MARAAISDGTSARVFEPRSSAQPVPVSLVTRARRYAIVLGAYAAAPLVFASASSVSSI